ncbi:MAG: hypothetical protein ACTSO9_04670 [Candidatus Helarchaeota archaeon]
MAVSKTLIVVFAWIAVGLICVGLIVTGIGNMNLTRNISIISILLFFYYGWFFAIWLGSLVPEPSIIVGLIMSSIGLVFLIVDAILASIMASQESF